MKIQYLPHTADVRMRIEGQTVQELFTAGVIGMMNVLKEDFCDYQKHYDNKQRIEIQSPDFTCLLIDFLSEVLSLCYVKRSIYCRINISKLSDKEIIADLFGLRIDHFDEEIKAVTYHEANVVKNADNRWASYIVFDI